MHKGTQESSNQAEPERQQTELTGQMSNCLPNYPSNRLHTWPEARNHKVSPQPVRLNPGRLPTFLATEQEPGDRFPPHLINSIPPVIVVGGGDGP
jgi:hypothetical protein